MDAAESIMTADEHGAEEAPEKTDVLPEASRMLRLLARGAELVLVLYLLMPVFYFLAEGVLGVLGSASIVHEVRNVPEFNVFVIMVLWTVIEGWFVVMAGATPGKLLLGMRVVREDTDAHPSVKQAYFRALVVVGMLTLGSGGMSLFLMPLFGLLLVTSKEPVFWDKWPKTRVVSVRKAGWFPRMLAAGVVFYGVATYASWAAQMFGIR